ncbi:MAG: T9SS type A sorting domain-containing protein, partial [Bacteroidia bacterium]|nr:T9SS type A sorting domain-containing protein [Bacteroidia bacterium]
NCQNFTFTDNPINYSISSYCSNTSMPTGGTNARPGQATGIIDGGKNEVGMKVTPNPVNDKFDLRYNFIGNGDLVIELYNSTGQQVEHLSTDLYESGEKQMSIDISNLDLQGGIYFLRASANGTVYQTKIIYDKP